MTSLREQPWWTPADQAELDLLAHQFTQAALRHRADCDTCSAGGPWCAPLREAFDGIEQWRDGRILSSKAAHLRALQWLRDLEVQAA